MRTTSTSSSSPDVTPRTRRRRVGQRARTVLRVLNPARLPPHTGAMDDAVRNYIDASPPSTGPCSTASTGWSWRRTPTPRWCSPTRCPPTRSAAAACSSACGSTGVSIYGWAQGHDGGFTARHPELRTSKGTIRLRPDRAADIPDGEFRDVVRAALDG